MMETALDKNKDEVASNNIQRIVDVLLNKMNIVSLHLSPNSQPSPK